MSILYRGHSIDSSYQVSTISLVVVSGVNMNALYIDQSVTPLHNQADNTRMSFETHPIDTECTLVEPTCKQRVDNRKQVWRSNFN
jgi:hypothetical protein